MLFNLLNPIFVNKEQISKWSDEELFSKYLNTQKVYYFDIVYKRLSKKVFAKCISFLKSEEEAKDAMQDIFVTILMKASKFEGRSKLSTWVYSITYNHCVDILRKKQRNRLVLIEDWGKYDGMDEVEDSFLLETNIKQLKLILDQLRPKDKMVLLMKYQDDMSIKDICIALDKSESAVKMNIKRAKQRFKDLHTKLESELLN